MNEQPLILICNDDGVEAPGLRYLIESVADMGHVIAVAPSEPRSGQSAAITVNSPLRIKRCEDIAGAEVYAVTGTHVDCVKLAMHTVLADRKVSVMLSGINHGSNAGNCVVYSGTMGAAFEACMIGIPAIGFSLLHHSMKADFSMGMPFIKEIVAELLRRPLPDGICLNVNIPARVVPEGVRVCRAARGRWTDEYERYTDPLGNPFYWLTGRFVNAEPDATDTDEYWLSRNYISAVPVAVDMTARDEVEFLAPRFDTK